MAGKRPRNPRVGSTAERLAEFVLSGFAFTTAVPWQEDVGHDFHCVLIHRTASGQSLIAGPSFAVQVKSRKQVIRYEGSEEIRWIAHQENPLFICFANPREALVDLYSTCALVPAVLLYGPSKTVLEPDVMATSANLHKDEAGVLHVPMGRPVLSLRVEDVREEGDLARWGKVLEPWIEIDRQNIVNSRARIHWVHWPVDALTNEVLDLATTPLEVGFYWNPKNLPTSRTNFLRSATLLRLEEARRSSEFPGVDFMTEGQVAALNQVLIGFWPVLGPTARVNLRSAVDSVEWPTEPDP
ncbi:MAG: hypothetical protein WD651_01455 [Acidimicrobiia bacterium]